MDAAALQAFLEASVRLGAPLALAALGETISERAGVINIGLEGSIIGGALGGALGRCSPDRRARAFWRGPWPEPRSPGSSRSSPSP